MIISLKNTLILKENQEDTISFSQRGQKEDRWMMGNSNSCEQLLLGNQILMVLTSSGKIGPGSVD